jgi:hypothetical protein
MPNPNAIVGNVARISPSVERMSAAQLLRETATGVSITFEDQQLARLYPGDRAAGMLEVLEELRKMQTPAYVEVDPATRAITRLLIPLVTRVLRISETAGEDVTVELEASHARHRLTRKNPDFAALLETLRSAQSNKTTLIVTETDNHEIIDARSSPRETKLPAGGMPQEPIRRDSWFRRWFCRWFCCWPFRWWCCVPLSKATQMFNMVSATTCDPLTVPAPCIPFLYPDDGCWARAHEMCRLMIAAGVSPRKVWIDGNLHVNTKNNPYCYVDWGWHVAPTLCVRHPFWRVEDMVIDPSLFTIPVSEATWKSVQGDPNATLTPTVASVYWRNVIPTDPNYVDTDFRLQYYRLQLKNRSLQFGPPPYANCP